MKHKAQNTTEVIAVVSMVIVVAVAALMFMNKKQTHLADLSGAKNTGISSSAGMYERDDYNRGASETAGGVGQTAMNKAPVHSSPTRAPQTTSKPQSSQDAVTDTVILANNNIVTQLGFGSELIIGATTTIEKNKIFADTLNQTSNYIYGGNASVDKVTDIVDELGVLLNVVDTDLQNQNTQKLNKEMSNNTIIVTQKCAGYGTKMSGKNCSSVTISFGTTEDKNGLGNNLVNGNDKITEGPIKRDPGSMEDMQKQKESYNKDFKLFKSKTRILSHE